MARALRLGAVGFLIAGPLARSPVSGGANASLLALGISPEAAARLSSLDEILPRVALSIDAEHIQRETQTLQFSIPGLTSEWIVLSAHIDGHSLAESAIDNATGMAVALSVARWLVPHVATARRGLKLVFFSAEEWALTGSRVWLNGLSQSERDAIDLNINLDSVAGGRSLTALVSGFSGLEAFVRRASMPLGIHLPLMTNSDHANFAVNGIPAMRLVAGFDDPSSHVRHVLTAADTRDKVTRAELQSAALAAAELVWIALNASRQEANSWRISH